MLPIDDPFIVHSLEEVSTYLQDGYPGKVNIFSVDVKDLYYSLPVASVCVAVMEVTDSLGPTRFQKHRRLHGHPDVLLEVYIC